MQAEKLTNSTDVAEEVQNNMGDNSKKHPHIHSNYGPVMYWYKHLEEVPREFSFFIAHEFFDALPIYKFQVK